MTYNEMKQEIENDIGSSFWIKKAIKELEKRDVVDAMNELHYLLEMFGRRYLESIGKEAS